MRPSWPPQSDRESEGLHTRSVLGRILLALRTQIQWVGSPAANVPHEYHRDLECYTGAHWDEEAQLGNLQSFTRLKILKIKQEHIINHIPGCSFCLSTNPQMDPDEKSCDNTFPECLQCLRMGLTCLYPVPNIERFDETIAQKLPPSLETLHLLVCDITCTVHLQALGIACAAGSFPCLRQVYIEMRGSFRPVVERFSKSSLTCSRREASSSRMGFRGPMKRLQSDKRHS